MRLEYVGDPDREYPGLGIAPVPGEFYELADNPGDGRWHDSETVDKISAADDQPRAESVDIADTENQE